MGQFVGDDSLSGSAAWVILAWGKVNIPTLGESEGAEGLRIRPLMDTYIREISLECRLHLLPQLTGQRVAAAYGCAWGALREHPYLPKASPQSPGVPGLGSISAGSSRGESPAFDLAWTGKGR
jgi:hypothetical protein